jgi:Large ribosomal RNA subunit accumulation protein YceD
MSEPFSRPIRVEAIPRDGLEKRIEADEAERAAIAAFNRLPAVGKLAATFTLRHGGRGTVIVRGELSAEITQTCVVTLEPFDASIEESIDLRFAPAVETPKPRGASVDESEAMMIGDESEPDPIVDGKIDLGAIASEFLTLNLDPYPRKPGAAFEAPKGDEDGSSSSPFSALRKS